jgi:hypothetical protein
MLYPLCMTTRDSLGNKVRYGRYLSLKSIVDFTHVQATAEPRCQDIYIADGLLVRRQIWNSLAQGSGTFGHPACLAYCCHWIIRPRIPPPAAFSATLY